MENSAQKQNIHSLAGYWEKPIFENFHAKIHKKQVENFHKKFSKMLFLARIRFLTVSNEVPSRFPFVWPLGDLREPMGTYRWGRVWGEGGWRGFLEKWVLELPRTHQKHIKTHQNTWKHIKIKTRQMSVFPSVCRSSRFPILSLKFWIKNWFLHKILRFLMKTQFIYPKNTRNYMNNLRKCQNLIRNLMSKIVISFNLW